MVKPPVPQPRTYFTAAPKETSGTREQGFHNGANENNAIKVSHIERGSSLHMQNPKPPVPLPRSRSHAEPLIQIPGATQIGSVQQEKDQESEKLLACEYQRPRPRRPPPPRPTKAPGAHRAPLLRQPSTWGGCNALKEDDETNPQLYTKVEKKTCPASLPPTRLPQTPLAPPRSGGLYHSVSEQGHTPLYLEILPDETTTNQGNVERNEVVHTFFSKRPLPPVPRSKSHPEPLYEEIQWTSNNQNVQSVQIEEHKKEDVDTLMAWWNTVEQWENMPLHCGLREEEETRAFTITAYRVQMGVRLFSCLLTKNNEKLRNHMTELNTIANNLDKMRKKAKIAAITGGTTGAVGGVAAVAGLVLAPMTMGASLVVTAIGAGVAAAGGVTGASAAITDKVNSNLDRKRVEKLVQDYRSEMSLIESCLRFVDAGMERMRAQDASRLRDVDEETVAVARLAELASRNTGTIQTACQTLKVLEAFSLDMDSFFTPGQSQRLKKGSETKFAGQIRDLVQQLEEGLTKLIKVRDILSLAASTTGVYKEHSYRL